MTKEQQKESRRLTIKVGNIEEKLLRIQAGFDGESRPGKRRKLTRAFHSVCKKLDTANKECYLLRKSVFCDLHKN